METSILFPSGPDSLSEQDRGGLHPFSVFNSETGRRRPLAMIVAIAADGAIGRGGDLLWHLPADLKHFKQLTLGHPVIMGRLTWESLPKGALPGRRNIVVTTDAAYDAPGAETALSLADAVARCQPTPTPFILGGGRIYSQALPMATELHVTRILAEAPDADTFFPEIPDGEWSLTEESDIMTDERSGLQYRFQTYLRKQ